MVTGATKFNLYLLLAVVLGLASGCQTDKDKKPLAVIQFHIETLHDGTSMNKSVPIYRASPVFINVETDPFLTQDDVVSASLVDTDSNGGFMIKIRFNDMATATLEENTSANPGKHIAVYCAYGEKLKETRWLAAPQIRHMISNGQLTFTPDATREEARTMVDGINNYVAQKKKKDKDE